MSHAFGVLADVLGDKPYLTGDSLALADVALPCHLDFLAPTPEGERVIAIRPALGAFQARMAERQSMAETTFPALARRFLPEKE